MENKINPAPAGEHSGTIQTQEAATQEAGPIVTGVGQGPSVGNEEAEAEDKSTLPDGLIAKEVGEITDMADDRWIGVVDDGMALIELKYTDQGSYRGQLIASGEVLHDAIWWPVRQEAGGDIGLQMNHFLKLCCIAQDICK